MAIQVEIRKKFRDFTLDVSFENENGILGILGASGCGKSMTLRCIAGVETPDEGRIIVDGNIFFDSEKGINQKPQKRRTGYLFQNYGLFPTMSVEKNIACGIQGMKSQMGERVSAQIQRFQLQGLERHLPSQLSGGQQQRVALARMLIGEPDILLLDEPFSALDGYLKDVLQEEMLEYLQDFPGEILMVTHSRDEIFKFCRNMTLLSNGHSLMTGNTKEIFEKPSLLAAARLTGCKNFSRANYINEHKVLAVDWNMELSVKEPVKKAITHVGIRGHWLIPRREGGENCMRVTLVNCVEAPFEQQYLFKNAVGWENSTLWWICPKGRQEKTRGTDCPPYLYFPPEEIMLLEE